MRTVLLGSGLHFSNTWGTEENTHLTHSFSSVFYIRNPEPAKHRVPTMQV